MAIGDIIKEALAKRNISQQTLAKQLSISPQAVSKWVRNESQPDLERIREISDLLNIDLIGEYKKTNNIKTKVATSSFANIEELNSIEKAHKESERILNEALIKQNYSHTVYLLMNWLVTSTIGLAYHIFINHKEKNEDEKDIIVSYLADFFKECSLYPGQYSNQLAYEFYLMGMDLFESFDDYKLSNHEYGYEAFNIWNKFKESFNSRLTTSATMEFKTALNEFLSRWGY